MEAIQTFLIQTGIPWDLAIILGIIAVFLLYAFTLGRDKLMLLLISVYVSLAVVSSIPYLDVFSARFAVQGTFAVRISTFLAVFLILFFLISHITLVRSLAPPKYQRPHWHVLVFGLLTAGLFVSSALVFLPQELLIWISPRTYQLFLADAARTVWVILPLIAMTIFRNNERW